MGIPLITMTHTIGFFFEKADKAFKFAIIISALYLVILAFIEAGILYYTDEETVKDFALQPHLHPVSACAACVSGLIAKTFLRKFAEDEYMS